MTRSRLWGLVRGNRLFVFVSGAVLLSFVLVGLSMSLYYSSGAFRLDLSRPEYESVRPQIDQTSKGHQLFDNQGDIDTNVIDDFTKRYGVESRKVTETQAFGNDVLSDEQLGIRPADVLPPQS